MLSKVRGFRADFDPSIRDGEGGPQGSSQRVRGGRNIVVVDIRKDSE